MSAAVVTAWPKLPEAIRAGTVAMVKAASGKGGGALLLMFSENPEVRSRPRGGIIMGGYGSGRWGSGKVARKALVESCLALDINTLTRARVVRPDVDHRGAWHWWNRAEDDPEPDPEKDEPAASLEFHARIGPDSGTIKLRYMATVIEAGKARAVELMSFSIDLVTTGLPSGGLRWWFICPAQREADSEPCRRRVGKLYLPRGCRVFACRHCYDLTYTSCRESRRLTCFSRKLAALAGAPSHFVERMLRDDDRERDRRRREPFQGAVFT